MTIPPLKNFNAVEESRKWKIAVAQETAGMTSEEVLAYFHDFRERYYAELEAQQKQAAAQGTVLAAH